MITGVENPAIVTEPEVFSPLEQALITALTSAVLRELQQGDVGDDGDRHHDDRDAVGDAPTPPAAA